MELKGSVFKRFEKNNLFQMACSGMITKINGGIQFELFRRHVSVDSVKLYVTLFLLLRSKISHNLSRAAEK